MEDNGSSWPNAWVRAGLELALLSVLHDEALHGYAIAAVLEEAGLGRLKGGSLYPALARLERDGLVEAVWLPGASGPGRKAYTLTLAGRDERTRLAASWRSLGETLLSLGQDAPTGGQR